MEQRKAGVEKTAGDGSTLENKSAQRWFSPVTQAEQASLRLAAIVESSDDAIVSKDLNGIVTSWNRAAERIFGYKANEIVGQPITLIIPLELQGDEPHILAKIRAGERIEHHIDAFA